MRKVKRVLTGWGEHMANGNGNGRKEVMIQKGQGVAPMRSVGRMGGVQVPDAKRDYGKNLGKYLYKPNGKPNR